MRIALYAVESYPLFDRRFAKHHIGGEAVQLYLLARAFRDLGHEVIMLVPNIGQGSYTEIDGIRFIATYREGTGFPGLRFITPKLTGILSALKNAAADLYYQSCAGMETGILAMFCRRRGSKFIFRIAHDNDCIPRKLIIRYHRDRMLYKYGLRRADAVAAQTHHQQELLRNNYAVRSTVIPTAVELPGDEGRESKRIDMLWINNMRPMKRPDVFLDICRRLPHRRAVMIGGSLPGQEKYFEKIESLARKIENLEFLGRIPYHEIHKYFNATRTFVNTSDSEGFPNTFLQAWIRQVPVISFFDPDGLIERLHLGSVPTSPEELADTADHLLQQQRERRRLGRNGESYVRKNHHPRLIAQAYLQLFEEINGSG